MNLNLFVKRRLCPAPHPHPLLPTPALTRPLTLFRLQDTNYVNVLLKNVV